MVFTETPLQGAFIIEPELILDERGFFANTWSQEAFRERGLNSQLVQANLSLNKLGGTLRGLHYQVEPFREAKLVCCAVGSIFDVIVDLREESPTFHQWFGAELSSNNRRMLYVPENFAHGFQTLQDNTEVAYQMSEYYHPEAARGLRWDDPALGIEWPLEVTVISERDKQHPLL
jgi:dTDP-4-dehydrorhamnose 3,5-epimerase